MIEKIINYYDDTFLKADGFDDAIIGVDINSMRLVYSVKKCIDILKEELSQDAAEEHFQFNIACAFMGEKTPIWCQDNF